MANDFTVIIEPGESGWWIASSPEVPGANGQGRTPAEARKNIAEAIELILEDLREEAKRNMSAAARVETISVG